LNTVQLGFYRDRSILYAISKHKMLTTPQVSCLLFPGKKCGLRKAQQRLQRLHEDGLVRHIEMGNFKPYGWYVGRPPKQPQHREAVNWAVIWLLKRHAYWGELIELEYEPKYESVRPDAFIAMKNPVTAEIKAWYVEADMGTNPWDKTEKYCRFLENAEYEGLAVAPLLKEFPTLLVTVPTEARRKTVLDAENRYGIVLDVRLADDVKNDVIRRCDVKDLR
jgi:hypothetical protein